MPFSPHIRLSIFYFTAFGVLGVYLPYFNLYLERLGFSALEIGTISALLPLSIAVIPTMGGLLSERLGRRRVLVIVASVLSLFAYSFLLGVREFIGVFVVVAVFAVVRAPALPLVDATAVRYSEEGGPPYGRMRMWGSLAFIVMALTTGPAVGRWGERTVLYMMILVLAGNVFATFLLPRDRRPVGSNRLLGGLASVIRRPRVLLFLGACVLAQASHAPYYVFFSIHLEKLGYHPRTIGFLWALAVACEILAMLKMPVILKRLGTLPTMGAGLVLAAVRWAICAVTGQAAPLVLAQMLHAGTFAAFHVAAVKHTHTLFGEERAASGQAVYSSATFGVGNILGMVLSGFFHDRLGVPGLFAWASGGALLGALLVTAAAGRGKSAGRGL